MIDPLMNPIDLAPILPPELAALFPLAWIALGLVAIRLLSADAERSDRPALRSRRLGPLSSAAR